MYQCSKNNMKIFHENVFGYWANRKDKAELNFIGNVSSVECALMETPESTKLGVEIPKCGSDRVDRGKPLKLSVKKGEEYCKFKNGSLKFKKEVLLW